MTRYSLGFWLNIRSRLVPWRLAAMVLAMVLVLAGNAQAFVAIQPTFDTAQIAQALQSPGVRIENIRLVKGREEQLGLFDNTASRGEIPNIALGSGLVDSRPLFSLDNKNQRTSAPGLFVNLPHRVFSTVSGQLTLEARWLAVAGNPAVNWPVSFYQTQCQNPEGASDPLVSPITLQAEQTLCLRARVFIPADAPQGQAANLEIRAQFIPFEGRAGSVTTSVLDRLTVIEEAGRLTLNKWVENLSRSAGRSTANQAQPGDLLRYTIAYTNVGTAPIKALYISDTVPAFTRLSEAVTCPVNQPEGLGRCLVQLPASSNNQPGYNGQLLWQFSGQLQPGDGGELSYQVRLE